MLCSRELCIFLQACPIVEEFGEICCHGKFHSLNEYGSQVLSFVVRATPDRCKLDFFSNINANKFLAWS